MGSKDISLISLSYLIILLIIPIVLSLVLKLGIIKRIIVSISRMIIQLFLVGIFLKYVFDLNYIWLNIMWLLLMIIAATISIINSTDLKMNYFVLPVFVSLLISILIPVMFFNKFVVGLENVYDAKYLIAIGGMLLGNCLRSNIIGVGNFYKNLRDTEKMYFYTLGLGASRFEALQPYIKRVVEEAIKPSLAVTATMGIVSLPGMMTGQILGGADPMVAIKYQISIMIAIFITTMISVVLSIFITITFAFNDYDVLKKEIFVKR